MASNIETKVEQLLEKIIVDLGYDLYDVRYEKEAKDYINLPMNKEEYEKFVEELINAEVVNLHSFEKKEIFEGCMPIEIMAKRGLDTLRFGPLKPVGFTDPRTGRRPYAVIQLRQDNLESTLYNIVGFQTHLTISEQKRVFRILLKYHKNVKTICKWYKFAIIVKKSKSS